MSTPPRIKCTIPPPDLCTGDCYWEGKCERQERYVKTSRLSLMKTTKEKKALETKLKTRQSKKVVDERDPDEYQKPREEQQQNDEEVKDLVETFKRKGVDT